MLVVLPTTMCSAIRHGLVVKLTRPPKVVGVLLDEDVSGDVANVRHDCEPSCLLADASYVTILTECSARVKINVYQS